LISGAVDNPATADFETSKGVKVVESFEDMGLKDELLRGIYDFGTFSFYQTEAESVALGPMMLCKIGCNPFQCLGSPLLLN
jgi:hypothetical protein